MNKRKLIIADDDQTAAHFMRKVGEQLNYEVTTVSNGKQLLSMLDSGSPDIIILDMVMPEMDGIEALAKLAERECKATIILVSGYQENYLTSADILGKAKGLNIHGTLSKPIKIDLLNKMLQA